VSNIALWIWLFDLLLLSDISSIAAYLWYNNSTMPLMQETRLGVKRIYCSDVLGAGSFVFRRLFVAFGCLAPKPPFPRPWSTEAQAVLRASDLQGPKPQDPSDTEEKDQPYKTHWSKKICKQCELLQCRIYAGLIILLTWFFDSDLNSDIYALSSRHLGDVVKTLTDASEWLFSPWAPCNESGDNSGL